MNTEYFLARRLVSGNKGSFSGTFVVIAVTSIALGLAIMFVATAILTGFKKEIREKVVAFGGHVQVTGFAEGTGFEPRPFDRRQPFYYRLKQTPGIDHIQAFATKAGIIKTSEHIQGVVLKGVGPDYDWTFFRDRLEGGHVPSVADTVRTDEVIISKKTADLLNLRLNDDLRMYFIAGDHTLGRKFRIAGIYNTGLEEFDNLYVMGDIRHIRKLNNWGPEEIGGFEVFIDRFDDIDKMGVYVYHQIGFSLDATTIKMQHQQIFDWLDLQDINVIIILVLVVLVSSTTIISTLLILILERTTMIGILKSLGMRNRGIRNIFLYNGLYIAGRGMLWGNALAFTLCLLQKKFALVTLPVDTYYVSVIPINLDIWNILAVNAGTFLICYLVFLVPSFVVARISPVRTIRFA